MVKLNKYSRSVSIIGIGATPFMDVNGNPDTKGLTEGELFGAAAISAMEDAGLEPRDIDFFYHASANPHFFNFAVTPNMQVADWIGMRGKGSVHHSEACCSGYVALEQAVMAVASGTYDIVLTGGVEMPLGLPDGTKPACFRKSITTEDIIPDLDSIYERCFTRMMLGGPGVIFDDWMEMYARENGLSDEQVDEILNTMAYHSRRAASLNPLALYQDSFDDLAKEMGYDDPMEYLKSPFNPKMTHYLRVSGNAPSADGAVCVIVCPTEMAKKYTDTPIEILGIGASAIDAASPHLEKRATAEAARQVYELTGMKPEDMDLFMCNDFILSSQLLAAEEVGYLPKGEGWKYVLDGRTAFDGDKPCCTNGGRTAYGHAMGASGLADIYEAVLQMKGLAGKHQVKKKPEHTFIRGYGGAQNVRAIILETVK